MEDLGTDRREGDRRKFDLNVTRERRQRDRRFRRPNFKTANKLYLIAVVLSIIACGVLYCQYGLDQSPQTQQKMMDLIKQP